MKKIKLIFVAVLTVAFAVCLAACGAKPADATQVQNLKEKIEGKNGLSQQYEYTVVSTCDYTEDGIRTKTTMEYNVSGTSLLDIKMSGTVKVAISGPMSMSIPMEVYYVNGWSYASAQSYGTTLKYKFSTPSEDYLSGAAALVGGAPRYGDLLELLEYNGNEVYIEDKQDGATTVKVVCKNYLYDDGLDQYSGELTAYYTLDADGNTVGLVFDYDYRIEGGNIMKTHTEMTVCDVMVVIPEGIEADAEYVDMSGMVL